MSYLAAKTTKLEPIDVDSAAFGNVREVVQKAMVQDKFLVDKS